jgi:hypothetical protein
MSAAAGCVLPPPQMRGRERPALGNHKLRQRPPLDTLCGPGPESVGSRFLSLRQPLKSSQHLCLRCPEDGGALGLPEGGAGRGSKTAPSPSVAVDHHLSPHVGYQTPASHGVGTVLGKYQPKQSFLIHDATDLHTDMDDKDGEREG